VHIDGPNIPYIDSSDLAIPCGKVESAASVVISMKHDEILHEKSRAGYPGIIKSAA
jgi:hypothetical protein